GKFKLSVRDSLTSLRISAPRRAEKVVAVPSSSADSDLGKIILWPSGRVCVSIVRTLSNDHLTWTINRAEPGSRVLELVRDGTAKNDGQEILIDNLEPSQYLVVINGDGPLQHYAVPVVLQAGQDVSLPVTISPAIVDVEVTTGDKSVSDA